MKINLKNLPKEIFEVFRIFNQENIDSVRLVGGCVRDLLLGREVADYDFATKFTPEESIEIIRKNGFKAIPTGIKYGTVTIIIRDWSFEITTLRSDNNTDGRHPEAEFVEDYFEDAKRRDFTINALYLDENGQIYDYFTGIDDLKARLVRFIGQANDRIKEDYLRILRFFRFTAIYANQIDEDGLEACINNKDGLEILSSDRIREELIKFFNSQNSEFLLSILTLMEENGIRQELITTKFNLHNLRSILELENLLQVELSARLILFSLLFNDKEDLTASFTKLNLSNADKKYYHILSNYINAIKEIPNQKDLQKLSVYLQKDLLQDLYLFKIAQNSTNALDLDEIWQNLDFIAIYEPPTFPVDGNDLMALGYEGSELGEMLLELKEDWLESEFKLKKEELINLARK